MLVLSASAQQGPLIATIAGWLKPGGVFLASFGAGSPGEWIGEWLGTTMFFGSSGVAATLDHIAAAGMAIRRYSIDHQDDEDADFLWVVANK